MPEGDYEFEPLQPWDPRRIGRFPLSARLGEGGMGRVFLAHTPGGQPIAVKVIKSEWARDPGFAERFAREVKIAQRVDGIHVARLLDADSAAQEPWLASSYVAGPSLHELVAGTGPLPVRDTLAVTVGIARALETIHGALIVHRDLKPSNVMLDEAGPKVIDFGIAKSIASSSAALASATMIGTPSYMSPEQVRGQPVSFGSDLFALGATVYYIATGRQAFSADHQAAVIHRILDGAADLTALDPQLRDIVGMCLKKNPAKRPTPAQVIEACLARLGPMPPSAFLEIAQATPEIRARTTALRALHAGPALDPSPVGQAPGGRSFPGESELRRLEAETRLRDAAIARERLRAAQRTRTSPHAPTPQSDYVPRSPRSDYVSPPGESEAGGSHSLDRGVGPAGFRARRVLARGVPPRDRDRDGRRALRGDLRTRGASRLRR